MKIRNLILLMTTAAAASSLYSCKEEPYVITAEEEYTRNFIKEFGLIDPNQDWNLAEGSAVTVKVGSTPAQVKAYMKVDNTYYLMADLKDVAGEVKIPFDMPEGTKDIMVKINGTRYYTSPGGIVDPNNPRSRVLIEPGEGDAAQVSWVDYRLYTAAEIFPIIYPNDVRWPNYTNGLGELRENNFTDERQYGIIPEGDPSNYDNPNIIMDFWFKDVDEDGLTIYPMYWNTDLSYHTIGIFYFVDENGKYCAPDTEGATMVRQDLFEDKNHNDNPKQLLDCGVSWKFTQLNNITLADINAAFEKNYKSLTEAKKELFTPEKVISSKDLESKWYEMTRNNAQILFKYLKSAYPDKYTSNYLDLVVGTWDNEESEIQSYGNIGCEIWDNKVFDWENVSASHTYAARGINIKVPSDLQFGFYLKRESGDKYGYFYSITAYNCAAYQTEDDAIKTWIDDANNSYSDPVMTNKPFAATYKHPASNNWFFSFEDAASATQYWDLNDLVFGLLGNFDVEDDDHRGYKHEDPKDPDDPNKGDNDEVDEPYQWLLAVEDLGATDDFDFNDIIIGISSVAVSEVPEGARIVGSSTATAYKKVTYKALAAGGTRAAYVFYGDELLYPDGKQGRAEWHKWFGDGSYSHTTMINTNAGPNATGETCTIYYETFTLDKATTGSYDVVKNGLGFKVGIDTQTNTSSSEISTDYFETATNAEGKPYFVKPADAGEAPQMFLIPDTWEGGGKWQWPIERSHISSCYTGFKDWVTDKDSDNAINWYKKANGKVCRPTK